MLMLRAARRRMCKVPFLASTAKTETALPPRLAEDLGNRAAARGLHVDRCLLDAPSSGGHDLSGIKGREGILGLRTGVKAEELPGQV
jgi:hypothetical protein